MNTDPHTQPCTSVDCRAHGTVNALRQAAAEVLIRRDPLCEVDECDCSHAVLHRALLATGIDYRDLLPPPAYP